MWLGLTHKECIQNFSKEISLETFDLQDRERDGEYIIKIDLRKMGSEDVEWMELAQNHV